MTELGLIAKMGGDVLGGSRQARDDEPEHHQHLADKYVGRLHPTASRLRGHVLHTARLRRGLMRRISGIKDAVSL